MTYAKSIVSMDTQISVNVVSGMSEKSTAEKIDRAFAAFRTVEEICSRFNPDSELMRLLHTVGAPVPVSRTLFEAIAFACEVAEFTEGAFDPTVGRTMEQYGFNRHYLTGDIVQSDMADTASGATPVGGYKDIVLNATNQTVMLKRPQVIDLGAIAKGLAIDLAARELEGFDGFTIDAGGDVYVRGVNERGETWSVGIRHPYEPGHILCALRLTNAAICTSGSYERRSKTNPSIHHLINPITHLSADALVSATVVAPFAMMADAFSTAVFIQGIEKGLETLDKAEIEGILITPTLGMHLSANMEAYFYE